MFFNEALINNGEFRWSATYNKSDKVRPENTQLLLKYEITKYRRNTYNKNLGIFE